MHSSATVIADTMRHLCHNNQSNSFHVMSCYKKFLLEFVCHTTHHKSAAKFMVTIKYF